jgi:amino acid adenylation domain-containing protein
MKSPDMNDPARLSEGLAGLTPEQRALLMLRLRQRSAQRPEASEPAMAPVPRDRGLPLSFAQQRLWFLDQWQPRNPAWNISSATRLTGRLDVTALRRAFDGVIGRQESLRTGFLVIDGQPVQIIHPPAPLPAPLIDLSALPEPLRGTEALRLADEDSLLPFDLSRDRLVRAALLRLGPEEHFALVTMHHIVSDGWSIGVFVHELGELYAAAVAGRPAALPELPVQVPDFAVWQREWLSGDRLEAQLKHWRQALAGAPLTVELPVTKPWPAARTAGGAAEPFVLPAIPTAELRTLSRREGGTVFITLLAAFGTLLHRYSGATDLLIGSPIAGRNRGELEGLIGFFVNTLVLRADLAGDPPFRQLLGRVRETMLDAQGHQDLPFEKLVEELRPERDPLRPPLVQVVLSFQNTPAVSMSLPGLELSSLQEHGTTARYDLLLSVNETEEGLAGYFEYSTDLFDAPAARRIAGHFAALLEAIAEDSGRPVSELPMLTGEERVQIEAETAALPVFASDEPLHHLFEASVARQPEAVAVTMEGESTTYAELNARANALAHQLRRMGVGPEVRVGLCAERSPGLIAGLLGILKAGGAYVPLDPDLPAERLAYLVADSKIRAAVCGPGLEGRISGVEIVGLDQGSVLSNFDGGARPDHAAYVIYTSGSTGRPKGVVVRHGEVARLLSATQPWFGFSPEDVWTLFHSYAFDFSVWEIWGALAFGGRLVIVPFAVSRSPEALHALLARERVTVLNQTPSAFRQLVQWEREQPAPAALALREVIFGGEALEPALLGPWFERHGDARPRMVNMYGITETTVHVTFRAVREADLATAPGSMIGAPIPDLRIVLLDPQGQPVPDLVPGEIHVGGAGLARGYLNRPELTAERFVPDPLSSEPGARLYRSGDLARRLPDGDLQYLGRIDHQVKIRGFRIELGEIEAALAAHPTVAEAAVLALDREGSRQLVAWIVPRPGASVAPVELRKFVAGQLPEPMVPARFVQLDALPLTANGKLDRAALAASDVPAVDSMAVEEYEPPATPAEQILAEVWAEALGLERVGANDGFFALGGDSILSLRVLSRARERGVDVSLQQLFQLPTLRELARAAGGTAAGVEDAGPFSLIDPEERDRLPEGIVDAYPLARLQSGMLFHTEMRPDTAVYHDVFSVWVRAPFDEARLRQVVEEAVARHPVLRTSFDLSSSREPLQLVHAAVPAPFAVDDLRPLPEAESERVVQAWLEAERHRGFIWSVPPLARFHVHRRTDDSFQLTLSFHHSVLDGWSAATLLAGLFRSYTGEEPGEAPPPGVFREFVRLERETLASDAARALWEDLLAGAEPSHLPRWPPATGEAAAQDSRDVVVAVSTETAEGLRAVARAAGTPLKSALLAAHVAVLARWTGSSDVLTGLVANGRPEIEGGDRALGLFLNTLPLRIRLGIETWAELTAALFAQETRLLPHRRFPLAELQAGREALFDTLFNFVHFHVYQGLRETPGVEILEWHGYEETDTALNASFQVDPDSGRIDLRVSYLTGEVDPRQAEAIAGAYARALDSLAAHPGARVAEAQLLSAAEQRQVLSEWSEGLPAAPGCDLPVYRLVARVAAATPDRIAVEDSQGTRLTYGELMTWSHRTARHLRTLGVGSETLVGVALERSVDRIVVFLAILEAGGAYVPLDLTYPRERLALMVEEARVPLILAESARLAELAFPGVRTLGLAGEAAAIARQKAEAPPEIPARLAYVMFTSGSTGKPKAVGVEHRGIARLVLGEHGPEEIFLEISAVSFDASTLEIWGALLNGGRLAVPPPGLLSNDDMERLIQRHGVTSLQISPSHFHQIAATRPEILRGTRFLSIGGDVLFPEAARRVLEVEPGCRLRNDYGPTENTTHTTSHTLRPPIEPGVPLPIGRPIPGTRVYLVDAAFTPVPPGVPGELVTGGDGLARGYLNRPDLTAERFVPDPFTGEPGARLYRTGDRAAWGLDGVIRFLGRMDNQVKIRGFRIEPGEVEGALAAHPEVGNAAVAVRDDLPGGKGLAAFLSARGPVADPAGWLAGVRAFLAERLPPHMIPAVFQLLPELPLTPVGKVDRRALAQRGLRTERPVEEAAAPRDPVEETLAAVWREVLRTERTGRPVGRNDDFFELGGSSLVAIQAVSRLRAVFGVEVPLRWLFDAPTIAALAPRLAGLLRAEPDSRQAPPLRPRPESPAELPLSFAQERLWFIEQLQPGTSTYNMATVARLSGALDTAALLRAVDALAARQESLRTRFPTEDSRPVQVIDPPRTGFLAVVDLGGLPESIREDAARALLQAEALRPFDLAAGPLFRALLLRLSESPHPLAPSPATPPSLPGRGGNLLRTSVGSGEGGGAPLPARVGGEAGEGLGVRVREAEHSLLLAMHHIVSDGWSMEVLIRELTALYAAGGLPERAALPVLPVQYADYALWQREWLQGEILEERLRFWRERLEGAPALLDLPLDRPRPAVQTFQGDGRRLIYPASLLEGLETLAWRSGATLFMALLAAFDALLLRITGERDLVLGVPSANRDRSEIEGIVGFFVNSLPVRVQADPEEGFDRWIERAREASLAAFAHADLPFEKLVSELRPRRDLSHTPIFQILFQLLDLPPAAGNDVELPGLTIHIPDVESQTAKFDFVLTFARAAEGLFCEWRFNTELFDGSTVLRAMHQLDVLLRGVLEDPQRPVADLPLLTAAEWHQTVTEWNATAEEVTEATVPAVFARQALRTPDAVAVVCEGERLTYAELSARVTRMARRLAARGVRPEEVVAVLSRRGPDLLTAFLAILEAGGVYLPLDPQHPPVRRSHILAQSGARWVIAEGHGEAGAGHVPETLGMDDLLAMEGGEEAATISPLPDHLAYLLFTSGSTGLPKGAMLTHRGMLNHLRSKIIDLGLTADDAVAQNASQTFDISIWQLLVALVVGGRVHILRDEIAHDPPRLLATADRERITILEVVPSVLAAMLQSLADLTPDERPGLAAMRCLISTGEALPPDLVRAWTAAYPAVRLLNAYGPTECSDDVSHGPLREAPAGPITPIGRPVVNMRLHVLDPGLRPVPAGVAGELCVGGVGVGRGYLGDPARTAEVFVPDPFGDLMDDPGARMYRTGDLARFLPDGVLEFLGRRDHQVKIRGFRIETGEVEAVLAEHPAVRQCAVLARPQADGAPALAAYVVPSGEIDPPDPADLRGFLRQRLPEAMIPAAFVELEALPLTPNGKLDRRALPDPFTGLFTGGLAGEAVPSQAPRNPLEELIAGLWSEALGPVPFGVHDDFFSLGGDSIKGAVLIHRLQRRLGEVLYVAALFDAPSVARLAAYLEEHYPRAVARLLGREEEAEREAAGMRVTEADVAELRRRIPPRPPLAPTLAAEPRNRPAVFVLSPPRSGSTLLRVLLGGHPQLFAPPELELLTFDTLAERRAAFSGRNAFWLEGALRAVVQLRTSGLPGAGSDVGADAVPGAVPGIGAGVRAVGAQHAAPDEARALLDDLESRGFSTRRFYGLLQEWLSEGGSGSRRTLTPSIPLSHPPSPHPGEGEARQEAGENALGGGSPLPEDGRVGGRGAGGEGPMLVDKSPSYALDLESLRRAEAGFESPKYIHLVRHPAAMVRSFEEARLDQVFFRWEHPFSVRSLAELIWIVSQENILRFLAEVPAERQHRVVFEDLVRDPRRVLEGICGFLGIEYDPEMERPYADAASRMTDGLHAESRMLGDVKFHEHGRIEPTAADRWRRLDSEDSLGEPARRLATDLGYRPGLPDGRLAPIRRASLEDSAPAPLSWTQERLWFLHQLDPGGAAYNMLTAFRTRGRVDPAGLDRALREIARRHETLRTRYRVRDGRPEPVFDPPPARVLTVADLTGLPESVREAEAHRLVESGARQPFDLAEGPLVRALLVRLNEDEAAALFATHHVACDGWSLGLWAHELSVLYGGGTLPEPPVQYSDFARWQRGWLAGVALDEQIAWWRTHLAGLPPYLDLPTDRPRPALQTSHGASALGLIPAGLTDSLRAVGRRQGASLFMVLLAGFQVLLQRLSGQDDLAVGTPIAGRPQPEVEGLIGCFLNTLALRGDLSGRPTFTELLGRVRESALGAYAHQDVPFEKLLEELRPARDLSRSPLFQVLFNMLNAPAARLALPGLEIEPYELPDALAKFDLTLYLSEREGALNLHLVWNADLFDAPRMEELVRQYQLLLTQLAEHPDAAIDVHSLVTPEVRASLPDPREPLGREWHGAVHEMFARQASLHPERVALVDPQQGDWTYGDLDLAVQRLAARLHADGIRTGDRVAIWAHRGAPLVWAILGVLRAGAAFVILDPAYPDTRLVDILKLARPHGFLRLDGAGPLPPKLDVYLDNEPFLANHQLTATSAQAAARFASPPLPDAWPESWPGSAAAVSFTSGSTGVPKGIVQTHGSMSHFIPWHQEVLGYQAADRHTLLSGLAHDPLQRDVFHALATGATLCIPDPARIGEPGYLAGWMRGQRVTVTDLTPAMAWLLTELPPGDLDSFALPDLRVAVLGGDVLTRRDVARLRRLAPQVLCVNVYGATESQRALGFHKVEEGPLDGEQEERARQVLPLGRGKRDVQLLVLGRSGGLAGVGEIGEIAIRSPHLAEGYLDDPEQTASRFVPNPFTDDPGDRMYLTGDLGRYLPDGEVTAAGRADQQIKIRGFRVEAGEVEAELGRIAGVREAVVVGRDDPSGGERRLVAYVVLDPGKPSLLGLLRDRLRERLPSYMAPSVFVPLTRLPLNPNGKVDRRSLPDPERLLPSLGRADRRVAPRDEVELRLARIWEDLLGRSPVGVTDDFFSLGGYSLLAATLLIRIETGFGRSLPLAAIFQAPTIEELARLLRREGEDAPEATLVRLQPGDPSARPPLFLIHPAGGRALAYFELASLLGALWPVWGLQDVAPMDDVPRTVEGLVEEYLRHVRAVQPSGPYLLAGWSFGGRIAYEMARQLAAAGEEVSFLGMIDTGLVEPPGREASDAELLAEAIAGELPFDLEDLRQAADPVAAVVERAQRAGLLPLDYPVAAARHLLELFKAHLEAARTWRPEPYPGRLTFFAAEEQPEDLADEPTHGWHALAAELRLVRVPGTHVTLIRDPKNLRVLADRLRTAILQAVGVGAR